MRAIVHRLDHFIRPARRGSYHSGFQQNEVPMPICLRGHARFRAGCGACEAGNYRSEGTAGGGAIGPRPSGRTPSRPNRPNCPQCDFEAGFWHAVYDHMIESHPGTMVSARIRRHFEYLLEKSSVPESDEEELSALLLPPGQVTKIPRSSLGTLSCPNNRTRISVVVVQTLAAH